MKPSQCTFSKKDRNCTLFISTAGWIFDAYDIVLFSILSIYILPALNVSAQTYAIIFGVQLATTAVGGVLFGILADKIGKREALTLDFIVYSLSTILIFFSFDWLSLLFARFVAGLAIGGEWGISSSLLNDVLGKEHRGLGFGILQSGWSVGVGAAAISARFVAETVGWRYSFLIGVLALLLAAYVYFNVPHIPPKLQSFRKALKGVAPKPLATALVVSILGMYAFYLVWTWLPRELVNSGILTGEQMFIFIGLSAITNGAGHILFGHFSDKFGRKRIFIIYAAIFVVSLLLILFIVRNPLLVLGSLLSLQYACGFFAGFGPAFTEIFREDLRTTGTSFVYNTGRGISGILIMVNLLGFISAVFNLSILAATAVASISVVLAAVLYQRL
ncbi:MAG: MFS transporter [Thermoplasmata archaeon]|nr:MFS transporter [Thermoplasmata archaeon]